MVFILILSLLNTFGATPKGSNRRVPPYIIEIQDFTIVFITQHFISLSFRLNLKHIRNIFSN